MLKKEVAKNGTPKERREKFLDIVARSLDVDRKQVRMSSKLFAELGSESLDLLDLAFNLEMEFRVRIPRTDILLRAADFFGPGAVIQGGVITELGAEILRRCMPEIESSALYAGLTVNQFRDLIRVDSFYRLVERLMELEAKIACQSCGAKMISSPDDPELTCPQCGNTEPLPSGETLLEKDLEKIAQDLGISTIADAKLS